MNRLPKITAYKLAELIMGLDAALDARRDRGDEDVADIAEAIADTLAVAMISLDDIANWLIVDTGIAPDEEEALAMAEPDLTKCYQALCKGKLLSKDEREFVKREYLRFADGDDTTQLSPEAGKRIDEILERRCTAGGKEQATE